MISKEEIERLAQLRSESGVASAYVGISPRFMYDLDHHITQAKSALKRAERQLTRSEWREALTREGERILQFLETWEPRGRGIVIFSCEPANIWEVVPLEVYVPSFVEIDTTSKTGVLTRLLNEYPPVAVVVIQRDAAKIYVSEQRVSGQTAQVISNVPGQHDQGGWAQPRFERHIEVHVAEHLGRVVEELKVLDERQPFKSLIVGTTERTRTEFLNRLPPALREKTIGTFAVDFKHATEQENLERARRIYEQRERKAELDLVQQVIDGSKSGGQGSLGVQATLRALAENRVRALAVADGVTINGFACWDCDFIAENDFSSCPVCGRQALAQEITDRAIEKAFLTGADIKTVYGEAADRLRADGGIGAVLRF